LQATPAGAPLASPSVSFSQLLANGIGAVNDKALAADNMVRVFALDDSIPVHQVTYALSQAQLSLELMMQVRNRLVEGYQQLMNMQL
jgi:flagellar hook-basal body complex protein FliE